MPWYLQSQHSPVTPTVPAHLVDRQKIPAPPTNPPTLLEPLLVYISKELGLDYLQLLDLRALDPPPALGSNLIMVVGTARSEKHLHVSADRFCRWLRSQHRLRPNADGLLGRNELKMKMKRRAKRLRILSNVGSKDPDHYDDALRTGWVCVHIPGIEPPPALEESGGEHEYEQEEAEEVVASSFVGFGEDMSNKVTIVVHMMTEKKRADVDLESLWSSKVKRTQIREGEGWGSGRPWDGLDERRPARASLIG
jgi:hypothetical protein